MIGRDTAAMIHRKGIVTAFQNARKSHRATCRYSPSCFTCPMGDCIIDANTAPFTNVI